MLCRRARKPQPSKNSSAAKRSSDATALVTGVTESAGTNSIQVWPRCCVVEDGDGGLHVRFQSSRDLGESNVSGLFERSAGDRLAVLGQRHGVDPQIHELVCRRAVVERDGHASVRGPVGQSRSGEIGQQVNVGGPGERAPHWAE